MSAIQQMHDIEVGGGLAWPEEGKILVYLGCPLDPVRMREAGEALVDSFEEAEAWLLERASQDYRLGFKRPRKNEGQPVVQRLFEAGIPGSVYWIYDGCFGMTLGPIEGGAASWAEAEAWLAEYAPL
jgi:hypothetical protein